MRRFAHRFSLAALIGLGLGLATVGAVPSGAKAGGLFCHHHRQVMVMSGTQSYGVVAPVVGTRQTLVLNQGLPVFPSNGLAFSSQAVVPTATMPSFALVPVTNPASQTAGQYLVGSQGVNAQGAISAELVASLIRQILPVLLGNNGGGLNLNPGGNANPNLGGATITVRFDEPLRVVVQNSGGGAATPTSSNPGANEYPKPIPWNGQGTGQADQGQRMIQAQGQSESPSLEERVGHLEAQLSTLQAGMNELLKQNKARQNQP